jgi:rhamnulokinase
MLCGALTGEYTNATSTQLLGARSRLWDDDLFARLGLPRELMPELRAPGTDLGTLRRELQEETGLGPSRVLAPPTHDTASAVAGTPLEPGWAYVSSGSGRRGARDLDRLKRHVFDTCSMCSMLTAVAHGA